MATAVPRPIPKEREARVTIKVDPSTKKISVKPDPFMIRKHQDEEVRWVCEGDLPFMVEFNPDDCPFYESQFSHDYPCSGLARRELVPEPTKIYKYTVRVVGFEALDPGGGVDK